MQRACRGEELTIGFLGGSITQGSLATKPENTYAYRVFCWWKANFKEAEFHYVNGGIGGTNSHYGVSRAVTDVLMYQPDFVMVDFSVNDEPNAFFQETYEGLLRKLLSWHSRPAVLILNNIYYDTGKTAQDFHNAVAERYHVPYVSIRDSIYRRMKQGEYTREELTADGLHPNDKGHELVAAEITAFLEAVRMEAARNPESMECTAEGPYLPCPMTPNAYEHAKRLTIRELCPQLLGFHADTQEKKGHLDHFKNGWIGKNRGDSICFEVEASCIAVQYRKTIQHPAAVAKLVVDRGTEQEKHVILDGNFEENWGDCLYLEPVLHHGLVEKHSIEIEIIETGIPFYLMALIVA